MGLSRFFEEIPNTKNDLRGSGKELVGILKGKIYWINNVAVIQQFLRKIKVDTKSFSKYLYQSNVVMRLKLSQDEAINLRMCKTQLLVTS